MGSNFPGVTPAKARLALREAGVSLNSQQMTAVLAYLEGGSKSDACRAAGYPETSSWSLFNGGRVAAAMSAILERFLTVDAAPAAIRALYGMVQDDKIAPGVRVQAANSLLDRAGFDAKRLARNPETERRVEDMSYAELQAELLKVQGALDGKLVDVTPDSEPVDAQTIDLYA